MLTDGTINKMMCWVDKAKTGVYFGQYVIGSGDYKSHHVDGTVNLHMKPFRKDEQGNRHIIGKGKGVFHSEPIKEITSALLGAYVINTDLTIERYETYEPRERQKRILFLDVRERKNPHNKFECAFYMVASTQHDTFEASLNNLANRKVTSMNGNHISLWFCLMLR